MAITDYVILQGKKISYEIARISARSITLDPKNPRVEYLLEHDFDGSATQQDIIEALWSKDAVKALGQAILANGGVREHILVQRTPGGGFVVREGNCRTACSIKLSEAHPEDNRFEAIPAHIFDQALSEEDIAVLIADVHVAKKISWDAYTQAKQIHELHKLYGKTQDWLADNLRMSKSKIVEYLAAYNVTNDFLEVHKNPDFIKRFSIFHELVRKKGLKLKYDLDIDDFKTRWFRWVAEGKIHDPRQVRNLEAILEDPDAAKVFDEQGYEAADRVLIQKDPALGSELFGAIKRATEALKSTPISDVQALQKGDPQKLIMLRNLSRALEDLATMASVKL
jgi:hypothetical protein